MYLHVSVSVCVCECVSVCDCVFVPLSVYVSVYACLYQDVYDILLVCVWVLVCAVCPCDYMSLCALVAVGSQAWVWFSISLALEVGFLTSCAQASWSSRSHGSSCLYFPSCCEVTGSRGGTQEHQLLHRL